MTKIEIVEEAINSLNRNKHTYIEYDNLRDDGKGGVDVNIKYPNVDWHNYGFVALWFEANHISYEDYSWMEGFKVSDSLRATNPEAVMILRIAWYFYKTGKDNHLF